VVLILLGLGLAAFFVNIPIPWIVAGEVVAMLGLAWRVSGSKQAQQIEEADRETSSTR
jgi:hypothetical protein